MLYHRALSCLVALIPLAGLPAWSVQEKPQLPGWPQAFTLAHGEQTSFLIPALKPGAIRATVTWTGAAPTLTLSDGQGKVAATLAAKTSPAELGYPVTQADLARGPIWLLTVKAPPGTAQPTADKQSVVTAVSGSVSAVCPSVEQAALAAALTDLQQRQGTARRAAVEKQRLELTARVPPATQKIDSARAQQLAEQEKMVRARFDSAVAAKPAGVLAAKPVGPAGAFQNKNKIVRAEALEPSVSNISPSNGCTDDVVTLTCLRLADAAKTEVVFHFGSAAVPAVPVAPGTTNNNGESLLTVKVPKPQAGYTATTNVTVTVVDKGRTPSKTSVPASFAYDPYPAPTVLAITPALVAAKGTVTIRGGRFQQGDIAHFVLPGQGDLPAQSTTFIAADQLRAVVPEFFTSAPLTGTLYVKNQGNRTSGPTSFVTTANQSAIHSVYPTQAAPGECVMLSGALLGNVREVTIAVRPRSQQTGSAYIDNKLYNTPSKMTIMQPGDNALLLRVPFLDGFSGPLLADLVLTGVGKPVTVPLTLTPQYVQVCYRLPCTVHTFQQRQADDYFKSDSALLIPWWLAACHNSPFFAGYRADETFYSDPWVVATKNNWSFVSADVDTAALWAGARLVDAGVNSEGRLHVAVHSYVDTVFMGRSSVLYLVTVLLRGPRGTPMAYAPNGQKYIPDSSVYRY